MLWRPSPLPLSSNYIENAKLNRLSFWRPNQKFVHLGRCPFLIIAFSSENPVKTAAMNITPWTFYFRALVVVGILQPMGAVAHYPLRSELPVSYLQSGDFLPFQSALPPFAAPLARGFRVAGQDQPMLTDYFAESFWIALPNQGRILEIPVGELEAEFSGDPADPMSKDYRWQFPKGTVLAHEIRFRDSQKQLFELRILENIDGKNWGFGAYVPGQQTAATDQLVLQTPEMEESRTENLVSDNGQVWNLHILPIPQRACARCHHGASSNPHRPDQVDETGPCGFTSRNPFIEKDWASMFLQKKGYFPFAKPETRQ